MEEKISYDEFVRVDMRVGKIIGVEDIEGADKLYKLEVDIGTETRELVAGLKKHYEKKDLKGKTCIVLVNLEPRKLKGIESNGMILAAVDENENVKIIQPEDDIKLGSRIR